MAQKRKNKRKSLAEVMARRNDVQQMLLEGKPKAHIVSWCNSNYSVKLSTVEHDIAFVRNQIKNEFQIQKENIIEENIARYENLYRFYMNEGTEDEPNLRYSPETAAKFLVMKEKLLHLHNPMVVVNNNTQNNNIDLKHLELDELLQLLTVQNTD